MSIKKRVDESLKKSSRQVPEMVYEMAAVDPDEARHSVDRAFDVLFDVILKDYEKHKYGKSID